MTTTLTELIAAVGTGSREARDALFRTAYAELRKLAHARLRGGEHGPCLDTTALVHESYLRFLSAGTLRVEDRQAFFAYASSVMRSVIIDTVRERQAGRRGGGLAALTLDTGIGAAGDGGAGGEQEILDVHDALLRLAQAEPRLAQVVEMRYFGGYTETEIADALGVTDRTVRRDWDKARLLLLAALRP